MDCVGRRFPASSTGTVFLRQLQLQYGEHCVFVPVLHIVRQLQQEHDVLPALVLPVLHIMREQQLQHGCNVMRQSNQRASRPPPPRAARFARWRLQNVGFRILVLPVLDIVRGLPQPLRHAGTSRSSCPCGASHAAVLSAVPGVPRIPLVPALHIVRAGDGPRAPILAVLYIVHQPRLRQQPGGLRVLVTLWLHILRHLRHRCSGTTGAASPLLSLPCSSARSSSAASAKQKMQPKPRVLARPAIRIVRRHLQLLQLRGESRVLLLLVLHSVRRLQQQQ